MSLIAVGVGDVVECAASFITWMRLTSPIGSAAGGSVNLSTSLSNVAKLAAHPKFVWLFNANCDGTIIYNDPVHNDISNSMVGKRWRSEQLIEDSASSKKRFPGKYGKQG
jgi:hypothetical protein